MVKWTEIAKDGIGDLANMDEAEMVLYEVAQKLDRMAFDQHRDAAEMARRFSDYAKKVEEGYVYSPPTGYSTIADIDRRAAEYEALRDVFKSLFRPATGAKFSEVLERLKSAATAAEASS